MENIILSLIISNIHPRITLDMLDNIDVPPYLEPDMPDYIDEFLHFFRTMPSHSMFCRESIFPVKSPYPARITVIFHTSNVNYSQRAVLKFLAQPTQIEQVLIRH